MHAVTGLDHSRFQRILSFRINESGQISIEITLTERRTHSSHVAKYRFDFLLCLANIANVFPKYVFQLAEIVSSYVAGLSI
jgi:hypothetical protein